MLKTVLKTLSASLMTLGGLACGIQNSPTQATGGNSTGQVTIADRLEVVSGNSQFGVVGNPLPNPLVVRATNAGGTLFSDLEVRFEIEAGDATLGAETVRTGVDGTAQVTVLLGNLAGSVRVKATLLPDPTGESARTVHFDLAQRPDNAAAILITRASDTLAICNEVEWKATLVDQNGNPRSGELLRILPNAVTVNGTTTEVTLNTDTSGSSTFSLTAPSSIPSNVASIPASVQVIGPETLQTTVSLSISRGLRLEWVNGPVLEASLAAMNNRDLLADEPLRVQDGCAPKANLDIRYWHTLTQGPPPEPTGAPDHRLSDTNGQVIIRVTVRKDTTVGDYFLDGYVTDPATGDLAITRYLVRVIP